MAKVAQNAANGQLQATIFKKCDRSQHRPDSRKQCANGTCQHTCEPATIETCRHAWTVRYSVNGTQREKSFNDELDAAGRTVRGSGLKKAQDWQLKHTADKRAQGKTYTDPKLADELFTDNAREFILHSARLKAGDKSRRDYLGNLNRDITKAFEGRTLAQMATAAAADEVSTFLNKTIAHRSKGHRQIARMIIVWSMDAAVNADKISRHKLSEITLTKGTAVTRRQRAADEDDDESATGFVFISDEQVRTLAAGGRFATAEGKRPRLLKGVGIAAWLQRTTGLRIREALGVSKSDFRTRKDGSHYLRLRSQATRDGRGSEPLKHRAEGEGRDVEVPEMVWNMVQAMPDGPLCPGPGKTRFMSYGTARARFTALTSAMGIKDYTTHSLRHQFASEALDADPRQLAYISAMLGHVSVETTLRVYVHATPDADARMRKMMNDRWSVQPAPETAAGSSRKTRAKRAAAAPRPAAAAA